MTSESTKSSVVLELKKRDYETALSIVQAHLKEAGADYSYREIGMFVEKVIASLAADVATPYFWPFQIGTNFYENCASNFSKLHIFNIKGADLVDVESQIFSIFNFVYVYRLESILKSQGLTDLDVEVLSLAKKTSFPPFPEAQLELLRTRLTVDFAVDRQNEIRHSLRSESEESAARLGRLVESIKDWEGKLDYWKEKTSDLAKLIRDQHQDLNFVGLSKAFSDLIRKRNTELSKASKSVKLFGVVTIGLPAIAILIGALFHSTVTIGWSILNFAVPSLTIELLLLYFFRIALRNEYSLKAQLLQLELRYSICAFIQGYAEFAKAARADDGDKTLEKFEALVFSGITTDIKNIPSQFDGLEQLASLIKGIRKGD